MPTRSRSRPAPRSPSDGRRGSSSRPIPDRRLGSALAWTIRHGADELNVVAEAGTGTLAGRAAEFTIPITVWHAEGRMLLPADRRTGRATGACRP